MTYNDILKLAKNATFDDDSNEILKLINFAYWAGREKSAQYLCDKASRIFAEQHARAKKCRYYNMAEQVVGAQRILFSGDYAGDMTSTFGNDVVSAQLAEELLAGVKNEQ